MPLQDDGRTVFIALGSRFGDHHVADLVGLAFQAAAGGETLEIGNDLLLVTGLTGDAGNFPEKVQYGFCGIHRSLWIWLFISPAALPLHVERPFDVVDITAETAVGVHQISDCVAGMQHRGVIFTAQLGADGGKGGFGEIAAQVHRNLTGLHDFALAGLREEHLVGDAEIGADGFLDLGDRDLALGIGDDLVHQALGGRGRG